MSKIARVKFIRDKEPNIKALTASSKVLDGALYIATDTGTMWMGTSTTSLMQIKDNINTNTTYTLTKSGNTITLKGSDGSSVNVTDSNTIYNNATASAAGLMSAADKSKLDSVATGANKTVVDASFIADSTNPVQSKVVKSALDGKSNTGHKHVKADITDFPTSMPASDVPAWAKAATKPSYSKAEVGLGNVDNTADSAKSVKYAASAGSASSASSVPWTGVSGRPSSMPASDVYAWAKASSKPSYSWSEISGRPTIPSVGNGTVTITQNGTNKGSFTLNQSGNATIALTDTNTNTWRPEEVIVSSSQPNASTCKLWIKV